MADTYGIVPADVAAELITLFPVGFTQVTAPTLAQVVSFITTEDLRASIAVQNASGAVPSASDRVAPLVRDVILNRVKARVLGIVYAGQAPDVLAALLDPYEENAKAAIASITELQTQAAGAGDPVNRVLSSSTIPCRDLLVCDSDLGPAPHRGGYGYGDLGRY
jgi:hypothetical protein